MNIDERKKTIDGLELLRQAAYKSYSDRREYEWKMCMAIWTLEAAYAYALITIRESLAIPASYLLGGSLVAMAMTFGIHLYWTWHLSERNWRESQLASYYFLEIQQLANAVPPAKLLHKSELREFSVRDRFRWSYVVELGVTLILALLVVGSAYVRSAPSLAASAPETPRESASERSRQDLSSAASSNGAKPASSVTGR